MKPTSTENSLTDHCRSYCSNNDISHLPHIRALTRDMYPPMLSFCYVVVLVVLSPVGVLSIPIRYATQDAKALTITITAHIREPRTLEEHVPSSELMSTQMRYVSIHILMDRTLMCCLYTFRPRSPLDFTLGGGGFDPSTLHFGIQGIPDSHAL